MNAQDFADIESLMLNATLAKQDVDKANAEWARCVEQLQQAIVGVRNDALVRQGVPPALLKGAPSTERIDAHVQKFRDEHPEIIEAWGPCTP